MDKDNAIEPITKQVSEINFTHKRKERGDHKVHLSKLVTHKSKVMSQFHAGNETELLSKKSCLERKSAIISQLDNEILEGLDGKKLMNNEIEETEEFQNELTEAVVKIEIFLDERKNLVESEHSETRTILKPVPTTKGVKLPKLKIAKLYKDPTEFLSFLEAFHATVNRDKSISDVLKVTYLKGFHRGDTAATIKGLICRQLWGF